MKLCECSLLDRALQGVQQEYNSTERLADEANMIKYPYCGHSFCGCPCSFPAIISILEATSV